MIAQFAFLPQCIGRKFSLLTLTVSVMTISTATSRASDLEIYRAASEGGATVILLFDNSGSMDARSIGNDYNDKRFDIQTDNNGNYYCTDNSDDPVLTESVNQIIYDDAGKATSNTITYNLNYCLDNKVPYYDRISRLKKALIPLLANPKQAFGEGIDFTKYKIGLGNFFYKSLTIGGGKIVYPARELTLSNRIDMINLLKGFQANTNTPSAHAYAEAGAYMLGTNTNILTQSKTITTYTELGYYERIIFTLRYNLYKCDVNDTKPTNGIYKCASYTKVQSRVPYSEIDPSKLKASYDSTDNNYYYKKNIETGYTNYSGFDQAGTGVTANGNYVSPVTDGVANAQQCGGNGIYFLTDGAPNGTFGSSAIDLMNQSLNKVSPINPQGTKLSLGTTCNSDLAQGSFSAADASGDGGWKCMGDYAKALRNPNNPKGRDIVTGTAGFGADFKLLSSIPKTSAGTYDCNNNNIGPDAKNLCKLGEKGYGYGEGGFYYVESDKQLADSVKAFIAGVGNKNIPAVSTGTMSVPLDSLNTLQSRGFAYTPVLDPKPGVTDLWNGNLKKYFIRNSTVTADDAGMQRVYTGNDGKFATTVSDIWNTINDTTRDDAKRPDQALPQVGGTYQQIFENSTKSRNLFVNVNGALQSVYVNNKKPVGFTALRGVLRPDLLATDATGDSTRDSILNQVLRFIGYPAQSTTGLDDTKTITGDYTPSQKTLGGVLHSIPQLITYSVEINSDGRFNGSTRKDSVLYGSMDGALHLVDDSTGQEQFTFIPKQLLDLQPNALTQGKTDDGKVPQGVDAPWVVYSNYDISNATTSGTSNKYQIGQAFAAGGLRMGGSSYYNLNITSPTQPTLVYAIGSNYANFLQNKVTNISGMKNGVTATTGDQAAYARMGQSWGKPSVGFVKSGGKKVMVNFLPGGYDNCYEDPKFKLNDPNASVSQCKNKTVAQGNAVYMVKVGTEETDANNKVRITNSDNSAGSLLWWVTNGTANTATTRASTLQASTHPDMDSSIVTEIRAVDRNYDGLTDHIYFADLGGRVWRADINNNKDTDNFRVDRVVKLLDVSNQVAGTDAPPRFYERPLFTVTNEVQPGVTMGQITVGTGNRSAPITDSRSKPDAIYSFVDQDVGKKDATFFCYKNTAAECPQTNGKDATLAATMTTQNLTVANLTEMKFASSDVDIKTAMQSTTKQGWYYPLANWLSTTTNGTGTTATTSVTSTATNGLKMFNEPDAQSGVLFVSIYNPTITLAGAGGCSASIQGATQRMLMCLPFGNCANSIKNSTTNNYSQRSFALAGAGIVDNIITQSKPNQNGSAYGVLQLYCDGANCDKSLTTPINNVTLDTINKIGTNRSKVMNPRGWWEY